MSHYNEADLALYLYLETFHTERYPGHQTAADGTEDARRDPGNGASLHRDLCGDQGPAVWTGGQHWDCPQLQWWAGHQHHLASTTIRWLLSYRRSIRCSILSSIRCSICSILSSILLRRSLVLPSTLIVIDISLLSSKILNKHFSFNLPPPPSSSSPGYAACDFS